MILKATVIKTKLKKDKLKAYDIAQFSSPLRNTPML